jgi:hypothetical protein
MTNIEVGRLIARLKKVGREVLEGKASASDVAGMILKATTAIEGLALEVERLRGKTLPDGWEITSAQRSEASIFDVPTRFYSAFGGGGDESFRWVVGADVDRPPYHRAGYANDLRDACALADAARIEVLEADAFRKKHVLERQEPEDRAMLHETGEAK